MHCSPETTGAADVFRPARWNLPPHDSRLAKDHGKSVATRYLLSFLGENAILRELPGFDKEGAEQLKRVVDTNKWIGVSDLLAVYHFLGIPAELVQFKCEGHPKGTRLLTDWVANYFAPQSHKSTPNALSTLMGASAVHSTDLMPVILQHDGHSRLIVGYEVDQDGEPNLLIFDPGHRNVASKFTSTLLPNEDNDAVIELPTEDGKRKISKLGKKNTMSPQAKGALKAQELLSLSRVNLKILQRRNVYQILYFPLTAPLTDRERNNRKIVKGEHAT